jgi:membrane protein DedA with SNARE-associated domain
MGISLDTIFHWVSTYHYVILLPIAIIEGPIISVIAGFLVSLHQLNLWAAFGILVLGDAIGDVGLYSLGRWGKKSVIDRWGPRLGLTPKRMEKIEALFKKHAKKTLLFGKWGHAFGFPILVTAGAAKEPFGEFITVSLAGTIPKTLFLLLIGFYFGASYTLIDKYFTYAILGIVAVVAIAGVAYWYFSKTAKAYFDEA